VKEQSALFIEIFGCDEIPVPSAPLKPLPLVDDPLSPFVARTGVANAEATRLMDTALGAEITGLSESEFVKAAKQPSEPITFAKAAQPESSDLNAQFAALVNRELRAGLLPIRGALLVEKRTAKLIERKPARVAAFNKMLRPLRSLFEDATAHEPAFQRLATSMEEFCTAQIIAES
jgi:hypothetical protein